MLDGINPQLSADEALTLQLLYIRFLDTVSEPDHIQAEFVHKLLIEAYLLGRCK